MIFICFTIVDLPDSPDPGHTASVHPPKNRYMLGGNGAIDRRREGTTLRSVRRLLRVIESQNGMGAVGPFWARGVSGLPKPYSGRRL